MRARDPLLDYAATEIGIDEPLIGPAHGLAKVGVRDLAAGRTAQTIASRRSSPAVCLRHGRSGKDIYY